MSESVNSNAKYAKAHAKDAKQFGSLCSFAEILCDLCVKMLLLILSAAKNEMTVQTTNPAPTAGALELSIVMPCLNEAETLATCIEKAQLSLRELNLNGEIVIADNGSSDGSQQIARALGARVVDVGEKGYGNAVVGGIKPAGGGAWVE